MANKNCSNKKPIFPVNKLIKLYDSSGQLVFHFRFHSSHSPDTSDISARTQPDKTNLTGFLLPVHLPEIEFLLLLFFFVHSPDRYVSSPQQTPQTFLGPGRSEGDTRHFRSRVLPPLGKVHSPDKVKLNSHNLTSCRILSFLTFFLPRTTPFSLDELPNSRSSAK